MAYDEDLANRIRELIGAEPDMAEQAMFGGLAFLIGGHMAVAASGQGGMLLRVDPEETGALLGKPHAGTLRDARARDARLASGRRGGRRHEAGPRALGAPRGGVRAQPAAEALRRRLPRAGQALLFLRQGRNRRRQLEDAGLRTDPDTDTGDARDRARRNRARGPRQAPARPPRRAPAAWPSTTRRRTCRAATER